MNNNKIGTISFNKHLKFKLKANTNKTQKILNYNVANYY